jgi:hypothetical protein
MKFVTSMSFCGVETLKTPLRADKSTGTVKFIHLYAEAMVPKAATAAIDELFMVDMMRVMI